MVGFRLRTAVAELAGARARADSPALPSYLPPSAHTVPALPLQILCVPPRALLWLGSARTRACRATVSSGTPAGRDSFASAELGQVAVGRSPEPGRLSPLLGLSGPSVAVGQMVPTGGPSRSRKISFSIFFYYLEREMIWKMFVYSNLL